jgi:FXSXX-COOH protein
MRDGDTGPDGGLIDVSGLRLSDLDEADETQLSQALRQVMGSEESDDEVIAGFQSRI